MFALGTDIGSTSQRNPRRRQRDSSDGSVKPPKPKRQRSILRPATSTEASSSRLTSEFETQPPRTGLSSESDSVSCENASRTQLAIRGAKEILVNSCCDEADGTAILTRNDYYIVSQLPSLPDQVRGVDTGRLRSFFDRGYALILTQLHAYVWPYSISTTSPPPTEIFTVAISDFCKDPGNDVPLGILVSNAISEVPGLMVLSPLTGNIIYWETASNAALLTQLRQKQNGLQGKVPVSSGEHITDVTNAEPSGVIVTLSSGRVAHVAVRDHQGKPTIIVGFLRHASRIGNFGLLSGLKNVLKNGENRSDVVAARSGASLQRGQRDVIILTSACRLELWDTHWNGGSVPRMRADVRNHICEALGGGPLANDDEHSVKILDFVVSVVTSNHGNIPDPIQGGCQSASLYCLIASSRQSGSTSISIVQLDIDGDEIRVVSTHPVEALNTGFEITALKPKLHIPVPGAIAFIIWGQTVILMSLARTKESPASQLLGNLDSVSTSFQDCLRFRSEAQYEIVGSCAENRSENKHPSCLAMIRGFGIVRIMALPQKGFDDELEMASVTAKRKLEQAVFYGTMSGNPIDFNNHNALAFSPEEMERAALDICKELLHSSSKHLSGATLSIEQHLRLRAKAMDELASLLSRHRVPLSQRVRWELLWGAEKLAAQRALWKIEEQFKTRENRPTLLSRIVDAMGEKFKTKSPPVNGDENDHVQHWFVNDTYRVEHVIPWITKTIREQKGNILRQGLQSLDQILQGSELSLAVLETAFRFREHHAGEYGLGEEAYEDGVLVSGYEDLSEFWTSQSMSYKETEQLLDLQLGTCMSWIQQRMMRNVPPHSVIDQIAHNSFRQLRVFGKMHRERVRWLSGQREPRFIDEGKTIEEAHLKQRKWQIFKLAGIGQLDQAISLAEEFCDMGALVELMVELHDQMKEKRAQQIKLNQPSDELDDERFRDKITAYFERFGEPWAEAFLSRQILSHQPRMILTMREYQPHVTQFLRKVPSYSRLSWINDVIGESDYHTASQTLEKIALEESDLWSKRVELSLAKLTRLAGWEKDTRMLPESDLQDAAKRLDNCIEVSTIQDMAYEHILPVLHGAIDQKAEFELAIDRFGRHTAASFPALHELLEGALTKLIAREVLGVDQLLDLLTLMDPVQFPEGGTSEVAGREFYLALRALHLSGYSRSDPVYYEIMEKTIWRRCMIRDDWGALMDMGRTQTTSELDYHVRDTALFRTFKTFLLEDFPDDTNNRPPYKSYTPSEVLNCSLDNTTLTSRFRPEQWAHVMHDLNQESDILRDYIGNGELGTRFKVITTSMGGGLAPATAPIIDSGPQTSDLNPT